MYKLAAEYQDTRTALAFWINNIDCVQSILNVSKINQEHTASTFETEKQYFDQLMNLKMEEFVNHILGPHIGGMMDQVLKAEANPKSLNRGKLN